MSGKTSQESRDACVTITSINFFTYVLIYLENIMGLNQLSGLDSEEKNSMSPATSVESSRPAI